MQKASATSFISGVAIGAGCLLLFFWLQDRGNLIKIDLVSEQSAIISGPTDVAYEVEIGGGNVTSLTMRRSDGLGLCKINHYIDASITEASLFLDSTGAEQPITQLEFNHKTGEHEKRNIE